MVETFFNYLFLADFIALILLLFRSDRNDFFMLFVKDYTDKNYRELIMFILMCIAILWVTIPISIYQIIKDQNQEK